MTIILVHRREVPPPPAAPLRALLFPSNISGSDTGAPYAVIEFDDPHLNGLPIWGPGNAGVTVIRRIRPLQQTGYYAQLWWTTQSPLSNQYWGIHPYPPDGVSGTTHNWEIAGEQGDFVNADGGSPIAVTKDQWYLQGARIDYNGGTPRIFFYPNLPSINSANRITAQFGSGYGTNSNTGAQIIHGDSPWFDDGYQHERFSGRLGEIKIIGTLMSEADMLDESEDMSALVTAAAQSSIWWGKAGFEDVDDLTCDFGTGRAFTRNDTSDLIDLADLT